MQVQLTTTLSKSLLNELNEYTKETGKRKNQILEDALSIYLVNEKKQKFVKSFQRAANDNDIIAMSEEGFVDYNKQLKKMKL